MSKEYIIWQDTIFMSRKDIETYEEETREMLIEETNESPTNSEIHERVEDDNYMCLDDARAEFGTVVLPDTILCIGDLGLWTGRVVGYKEINSLKDCLNANVSSSCYAKWYVDTYGNLRGTEEHHDGTNFYLYRMWKPSATESQRDALMSKIYSGKATTADINRLTVRLGDYIGNIYGWTFAGRKPAVA